MNIETFKIDKTLDKQQVQKPIIRMSSGEGCGFNNCHCSDGYWISISDGETGIRCMFDNKTEYDKFIDLHEIIKW